MKKEVSDKVVIILLILAIVFSIGGTMVVYNSFNDFDGGNDNTPGVGFVTLEVVENVEDVVGEQNEIFE